jgi:hypothetical protein
MKAPVFWLNVKIEKLVITFGDYGLFLFLSRVNVPAKYMLLEP